MICLLRNILKRRTIHWLFWVEGNKRKLKMKKLAESVGVKSLKNALNSVPFPDIQQKYMLRLK